MNIEELSDFPTVQQLARALWREGTTRGAAVLVGAGFSRNAILSGGDTPQPPLWCTLSNLIAEELYEAKDPLFKIEDANYGIGSKEVEPLYCDAISSKRYALFNLDANGEPILRKASAQGLGDKRRPYGDKDAPASIPDPVLELADIGVDRWYQIVRAALAGQFDIVPLNYHPKLQAPAMSRYAAATPDILNWFKTYNADCSYAAQVKPFNFLSAFQETSCSDLTFIGGVEPLAKARRRNGGKHTLRPIAPYNRDPVEAAKSCFDRETGQPISADCLKTYAQALLSESFPRESSLSDGQNPGFWQGHVRRDVLHHALLRLIHEARAIDDDAGECRRCRMIRLLPVSPTSGANAETLTSAATFSSLPAWVTATPPQL
jgi:hypothetical protein